MESNIGNDSIKLLYEKLDSLKMIMTNKNTMLYITFS